MTGKGDKAPSAPAGGAISAQVAALSAAMETLAESKGVDADAVTKAVTKAVAAKLDGLTLQFKAEG